ncbi:isopentenyl-diphosphate delta-isomerase [Lewinellaceae bacterium SD302]|nr:isopentenyl-diphosphate delta-isomerase [Lewinellaceae bacterium SD302]
MPKTEDPTAASRKQDHIELAFRSQMLSGELDQRFYYEPLLAAHPEPVGTSVFPFLGKELRSPLWVSSMTGGTELALRINENLARACAEFGMGMGLGSCRSLLYDDDRLADFNVRPVMGASLPLFGNLGLAQVATLINDGMLDKITELITKLDLDGLIVHVNPFQEWMQPEGDHFTDLPLDTLSQLIEAFPELDLIVKEVGQGMGPASLRALFKLPLAAIDTASSGGTNFSKLELLRNDPVRQDSFMPLAAIGHSAEEMTNFINDIINDPQSEINCHQLIISGGVRDFLDGYYLTERVGLPAIYGQASALLRHARGDYAELRTFIAAQMDGLQLARQFLTLKS